MKLIVKNNNGDTVSIQIKSNETFMDLKKRVEEEAGISLDLKDIALKGRKITEYQRVMEYFLSYNEVEEEPPMNVYCAVPGCKNTKLQHSDKVFFEFPTEEIRCHQWVLYCQRLNAGPGKNRLSLTSESTICSDHFRPDQFVKNTHTLLKRTAVPSVKMSPLPNVNKSHENLTASQVCETKNYFSEESQDTKEDINIQLRLCRLCSSPCEEFIMIFDDYGKELKIAEKINLCLPVEIHMTDGLPKQICRECLNQLDQLYDLADMVSLSQQKLKHLNDASNDDLALVSLDETGEEVILGTSASDLNTGGKHFNACCPLCKDGKIAVSSNKKINDGHDSSDVLPPFSEMDCDSFVNMSSDSLNKKKIINSQGMYDTDLDSQVDCSEDFTKENVLKLDDSSKSDNDQISECYSSLTSPLNIIASEDSCRKNHLSPITEEFGHDVDLDTESDHSINQPCTSEASCSVFKHTISCRICGLECSFNKLLRHGLAHSFKNFYQCVVCVSFFSSEEEYSIHTYNHEEEDDINMLYCDACSRTFKSTVSLASHMCNQEEPVNNKNRRKHSKTESKDHASVCRICNKAFPDDLKLQKHTMYIHNNKKAFCCEECGKVFKSEASMNYHQRTHQTDDSMRPYTCERCGKSFIRKSMLMNHMTSSHKHVANETSCFTCKFCYEAFPSTAAAVAHMDSHHKLECTDSYSFEMHTINRLYVCEFCERCYAEGNVMSQHRELHPSDSPYECKYCDSSYATIEDISLHRIEHTNDDTPIEYLAKFNIPRTFLCEYCERCFLNQVKYTEHLTVHYGPEPYQCRHCNLKFPSLSEAVEHRVNHTDSASANDHYNFYRPYECHYCCKTFAIEDALVKHIRMHTGEKPFICDVCGKGFSQSSGLYTHHKVHSTERPYTCSVCPRTFKIKGDRDVHVRKHSGDRPYKCEFCGKAFMTQHVYSQHRKIHTGERPYKCDVCGIAFRRSHVLTVHKRIHTGEKPNICEICGKRYRQKGDMLKHRRIQHGILTSKPLLIQM